MCSSQTEDTDLNASNMIAGANELTTIKHMSCKCRCKLLVEQLSQSKNRTIVNVNVSAKIQ